MAGRQYDRKKAEIRWRNSKKIPEKSDFRESLGNWKVSSLFLPRKGMKYHHLSREAEAFLIPQSYPQDLAAMRELRTVRPMHFPAPR